MTRPQRAEHNCETGITTFFDLTDAEMAQREIDLANRAAEEVEIEAARAAKLALKESAKAKLVAGTPLTPEEAATLVL